MSGIKFTLERGSSDLRPRESLAQGRPASRRPVLARLRGRRRKNREGKGNGVGAWRTVHRLEERRGLIHRGGRTRLHAVVERISFIAILDERDRPVTRLPRESQGRESTEF